jgi:hypothetical protein
LRSKNENNSEVRKDVMRIRVVGKNSAQREKILSFTLQELKNNKMVERTRAISRNNLENKK